MLTLGHGQIHETRQFVKVCDLGTAIDRDDAATAHSQVTPYLISRFYRAPEVILGMDYDYAIDVWSIGCTLFELFTGKILFAGENNNQMLKLMMELRGRMYPKYYKRGQMWPHHFDERDNFVSVTRDSITNRVSAGWFDGGGGGGVYGGVVFRGQDGVDGRFC